MNCSESWRGKWSRRRKGHAKSERKMRRLRFNRIIMTGFVVWPAMRLTNRSNCRWQKRPQPDQFVKSANVSSARQIDRAVQTRLSREHSTIGFPVTGAITAYREHGIRRDGSGLIGFQRGIKNSVNKERCRFLRAADMSLDEVAVERIILSVPADQALVFSEVEFHPAKDRPIVLFSNAGVRIKT